MQVEVEGEREGGWRTGIRRAGESGRWKGRSSCSAMLQWNAHLNTAVFSFCAALPQH